MSARQIWSDFKLGLRPVGIGLAGIIGIVGGLAAVIVICQEWPNLVYLFIALCLAAIAYIIGNLKRVSGR